MKCVIPIVLAFYAGHLIGSATGHFAPTVVTSLFWAHWGWCIVVGMLIFIVAQVLNTLWRGKST